MSEIKIKVRNLHKSFGQHNVLCGIDLDVKKSSSLVILGGSGTGKSVLIKSIIGLIKPDQGSVELENKDITNLSKAEKFKIMEKFGYLFQGGALFDSLTVQENIIFFAKKLFNLNHKQRVELARVKLEEVGLSDRLLDLYPADLSGGMLKRVALARAICSKPEIIFFDEPTTGLDPIMANVINDLIVKVRDQLGATTITITHDMISARHIATDVAMLYQGKVLWQGSRDEMDKSDNPHLKQFINGEIKGPITDEH